MVAVNISVCDQTKHEVICELDKGGCNFLGLTACTDRCKNDFRDLVGEAS